VQQSMNEEMETTKEELQSTNEELMTLNDELQNQNIELSEINNDVQNLFRCINIPMLMLNSDLSIRRFNNMAENLLNLITADVGRPIGNIKPNIEIPEFEQLIQEVLDNLVSREMEVQDRWGHWYLMQIRPYMSEKDKIEGVVVMFVDINSHKKNMAELSLSHEAQAFAEAIVNTVREPLLVLDTGLRVQKANEAFYQVFQVTPEVSIHKSLFELGNGQWNIPRLRELLEDVTTRGTAFQDLEINHEFPHIGQKTMLVNARPILNSPTGLILMAIEDVT